MRLDVPTPTLPAGCLVRALRPADTARTARLHRRLLPNGLFPRLGQAFVRRWHRTFLDTPAALGLGVVRSGEVVAFVLVTLDQRLYLRHVLRTHRTALLWRGALGLLVRPAVLVRFLRTRVRAYARHLLPRRLRAGAAAQAGPAPGPDGTPRPGRRVRVAVVHAVVTVPGARGLGLARALLETAVAAAAAARADHVALVTDCSDPDLGLPPEGAAAMYERLGWTRAEVRRHRDGRWVAEYRLPLARVTTPGTVLDLTAGSAPVGADGRPEGRA
ncbi:GNAT family N-acetyltransferase [Aquipuribacter sp. SD81]|uniref:GNAT family N-acetyltransferase n=1 Tax=Aquipuribacter sp. SD81 TaxID=3127703 RepID=UPI003017B255